jgi:DNA-binding beta-propeller fold protein YncE
MAMGQSSPALELKSRIVIPNVIGRMDHVGVDVKGQRLFMTAFNNNTAEVIDLRLGRQVRTLSNLANPQGAFYDPATNRLFISSSLDGTVKIFDGTSFQAIKTVKLSSDADNLRHDNQSNSVVVGYGGEKFLHGQIVRGHGDGALAFLDPKGEKTKEIFLDAHPESFQLEKSGTRVFVNVPDHKEIEVADLRDPSLLKRWPIATCTDNFPMALDEAHHRLFVGCRTPSLLLVFDTNTGRTVTSFPMVEHPDDLFYDAEKGRIYILGQGFIEIWQQTDADHYDKIGRSPTAGDGRTGLFVPEWGKLFVAIPGHGTQQAEVLVFATR